MIVALSIVAGSCITIGWMLPSNKPLFWVLMLGYVAIVGVLKWPNLLP